MEQSPLVILLIEENPIAAFRMQELLMAAQVAPRQMTWVTRLSQALQHLDGASCDLILLALPLADTPGMEALTTLQAHTPQIPIVVLLDADDEARTAQAIATGAQDSVVKGSVQGETMKRILRYALERHQLLQELRSMALGDELTGLYNRHGFFTLGQQQVRHARRQGQGLWLFLIALDDLQSMHDTDAWDHVLLEATDLLHEGFRQSDILARVEEHTFAVLATAVSQTTAAICMQRLQKQVQARNSQAASPAPLLFSIGSAYYDPTSPCTLDILLSRAEASLLMDKRTKARQQCL